MKNVEKAKGVHCSVELLQGDLMQGWICDLIDVGLEHTSARSRAPEDGGGCALLDLLANLHGAVAIEIAHEMDVAECIWVVCIFACPHKGDFLKD
jgi:hypothetical protein